MSQTVKVATLENEVEAQLLLALLQENEIPHLIRSYHDSAYDGVYQPGLGWGSVHAPEEYREEILCLLSGLRQGNAPQ